MDVLLLRLSLPDSSGLAMFTRVREQSPNAPVIVLAAAEDEPLAAATVREGAQDYLISGELSVDLLRRSIGNAIERKKLRLQLRIA